MPIIDRLSAMEILDSRGLPTVRANCIFDNGAAGVAAVPSGVSTGTAEALELRDGDPRRYHGMGCHRAVAAIEGEMNEALRGRTWSSQAELDAALIQLDGTPKKSRLGANAILAVSLAYARAAAMEQGKALYQYCAGLIGDTPTSLPALTINLFSGGMHAGKQIAVQDLLMVPLSTLTMDASLAMCHNVYHAATELVWKRYGMRLLTAAEGGLAPPFESVGHMLDAAVESIVAAGLDPGTDVGLAIDFASSQYYRDGMYYLDGAAYSTAEVIEHMRIWVDTFPILLIEDALHEEDWDGWTALHQALGERVFILGDDFLCTQTERIGRAVEARACNSLLLKLNQVGTLTEGADALRLARNAGWDIGIGVRSGETEDNWSADLAIAWSAHHFKAGSLAQSERLAKYNRLLTIERTDRLPMRRW